MPIVSLSQKLQRVEFSSFELDNSVVFEFFNSLPAQDRDGKLQKALYIGVLALMEDRLSSFLAKTSNELGTELESLKFIFEMKQQVFFKSSAKGVEAEEEIREFLVDFFSKNGLKDEVLLTGNMQGKLTKNKTGDLVCFVDGNEDQRIAIECKFDKSIRLGDISTKDIFVNKTDTAWSQLIEAQANRDGKSAIIVFDISSVESTLLNNVENVRYLPSLGFVCIVNSQKGDYSNLSIAYTLARDIVINAKKGDLDVDVLRIIVNRLIKDITDVLSIKKLVNLNIDNNKKILGQLEKSILVMEFNQKYLAKFLEHGSLSKEDLLNFYFSDEVKDEYKSVEKEIKSI